ncbi:AP2 domain transcription factor, putative [Plasmodium yoelii]|uniref:AP2 domain transcription factor AP2-HS n=2 Tax=Plasmodium yoelii TaxID=5861 RepID=A0AAE9WWN8_PLAYO|nr:AP2 domain transcription factor, putative [Plasmodium yoelii]WBY60351.1 AP2 domain transcription factor AP2-HS [Plasmodium yoelii yoelii]CDU20227.1 transcription factor with AP2 domain(s), putative [Plasmodium yoelii]VTZ80985.1 AP2 domain transcription factor, putative [Plasmodium yoelii]|eukprot:XP_022813736.1 AP2 domain transcription factor, putative [Plasmodium yoelii]
MQNQLNGMDATKTKENGKTGIYKELSEDEINHVYFETKIDDNYKNANKDNNSNQLKHNIFNSLKYQEKNVMNFHELPFNDSSNNNGFYSINNDHNKEITKNKIVTQGNEGYINENINSSCNTMPLLNSNINYKSSNFFENNNIFDKKNEQNMKNDIYIKDNYVNINEVNNIRTSYISNNESNVNLNTFLNINKNNLISDNINMLKIPQNNDNPFNKNNLINKNTNTLDNIQFINYINNNEYPTNMPNHIDTSNNHIIKQNGNNFLPYNKSSISEMCSTYPYLDYMKHDSYDDANISDIRNEFGFNNVKNSNCSTKTIEGGGPTFIYNNNYYLNNNPGNPLYINREILSPQSSNLFDYDNNYADENNYKINSVNSLGNNNYIDQNSNALKNEVTIRNMKLPQLVTSVNSFNHVMNTSNNNMRQQINQHNYRQTDLLHNNILPTQNNIIYDNEKHNLQNTFDFVSHNGQTNSSKTKDNNNSNSNNFSIYRNDVNDNMGIDNKFRNSSNNDDLEINNTKIDTPIFNPKYYQDTNLLNIFNGEKNIQINKPPLVNHSNELNNSAYTNIVYNNYNHNFNYDMINSPDKFKMEKTENVNYWDDNKLICNNNSSDIFQQNYSNINEYEQNDYKESNMHNGYTDSEKTVQTSRFINIPSKKETTKNNQVNKLEECNIKKEDANINSNYFKNCINLDNEQNFNNFTNFNKQIENKNNDVTHSYELSLLKEDHNDAYNKNDDYFEDIEQQRKNIYNFYLQSFLNSINNVRDTGKVNHVDSQNNTPNDEDIECSNTFENERCENKEIITQQNNDIDNMVLCNLKHMKNKKLLKNCPKVKEYFSYVDYYIKSLRLLYTKLLSNRNLIFILASEILSKNNSNDIKNIYNSSYYNDKYSYIKELISIFLPEPPIFPPLQIWLYFGKKYASQLHKLHLTIYIIYQKIIYNFSNILLQINDDQINHSEKRGYTKKHVTDSLNYFCVRENKMNEKEHSCQYIKRGTLLNKPTKNIDTQNNNNDILLTQDSSILSTDSDGHSKLRNSYCASNEEGYKNNYIIERHLFQINQKLENIMDSVNNISKFIKFPKDINNDKEKEKCSNITKSKNENTNKICYISSDSDFTIDQINSDPNGENTHDQNAVDVGDDDNKNNNTGKQTYDHISNRKKNEEIDETNENNKLDTSENDIGGNEQIVTYDNLEKNNINTKDGKNDSLDDNISPFEKLYTMNDSMLENDSLKILDAIKYELKEVYNKIKNLNVYGNYMALASNTFVSDNEFGEPNTQFAHFDDMNKYDDTHVDISSRQNSDIFKLFPNTIFSENNKKYIEENKQILNDMSNNTIFTNENINTSILCDLNYADSIFKNFLFLSKDIYNSLSKYGSYSLKGKIMGQSNLAQLRNFDPTNKHPELNNLDQMCNYQLIPISEVCEGKSFSDKDHINISKYEDPNNNIELEQIDTLESIPNIHQNEENDTNSNIFNNKNNLFFYEKNNTYNISESKNIYANMDEKFDANIEGNNYCISSNLNNPNKTLSENNMFSKNEKNQDNTMINIDTNFLPYNNLEQHQKIYPTKIENEKEICVLNSRKFTPTCYESNNNKNGNINRNFVIYKNQKNDLHQTDSKENYYFPSNEININDKNINNTELMQHNYYTNNIFNNNCNENDHNNYQYNKNNEEDDTSNNNFSYTTNYQNSKDSRYISYIKNSNSNTEDNIKNISQNIMTASHGVRNTNKINDDTICKKSNYDDNQNNYLNIINNSDQYINNISQNEEENPYFESFVDNNNSYNILNKRNSNSFIYNDINEENEKNQNNNMYYTSNLNTNSIQYSQPNQVNQYDINYYPNKKTDKQTNQHNEHIKYLSNNQSFNQNISNQINNIPLEDLQMHIDNYNTKLLQNTNLNNNNNNSENLMSNKYIYLNSKKYNIPESNINCNNIMSNTQLFNMNKSDNNTNYYNNNSSNYFNDLTNYNNVKNNEMQSPNQIKNPECTETKNEIQTSNSHYTNTFINLNENNNFPINNSTNSCINTNNDEFISNYQIHCDTPKNYDNNYKISKEYHRDEILENQNYISTNSSDRDNEYRNKMIYTMEKEPNKKEYIENYSENVLKSKEENKPLENFQVGIDTPDKFSTNIDKCEQNDTNSLVKTQNMDTNQMNDMNKKKLKKMLEITNQLIGKKYRGISYDPTRNGWSTFVYKDGVRYKKFFSSLKYGNLLAKKKCIEWRVKNLSPDSHAYIFSIKAKDEFNSILNDNINENINYPYDENNNNNNSTQETPDKNNNRDIFYVNAFLNLFNKENKSTDISNHNDKLNKKDTIETSNKRKKEIKNKSNTILGDYKNDEKSNIQKNGNNLVTLNCNDNSNEENPHNIYCQTYEEGKNKSNNNINFDNQIGNETLKHIEMQNQETHEMHITKKNSQLSKKKNCEDSQIKNIFLNTTSEELLSKNRKDDNDNNSFYPNDIHISQNEKNEDNLSKTVNIEISYKNGYPNNYKINTVQNEETETIQNIDLNSEYYTSSNKKDEQSYDALNSTYNYASDNYTHLEVNNENNLSFKQLDNKKKRKIDVIKCDESISNSSKAIFEGMKSQCGDSEDKINDSINLDTNKSPILYNFLEEKNNSETNHTPKNNEEEIMNNLFGIAKNYVNLQKNQMYKEEVNAQYEQVGNIYSDHDKDAKKENEQKMWGYRKWENMDQNMDQSMDKNVEEKSGKELYEERYVTPPNGNTQNDLEEYEKDNKKETINKKRKMFIENIDIDDKSYYMYKETLLNYMNKCNYTNEEEKKIFMMFLKFNKEWVLLELNGLEDIYHDYFRKKIEAFYKSYLIKLKVNKPQTKESTDDETEQTQNKTCKQSKNSMPNKIANKRKEQIRDLQLIFEKKINTSWMCMIFPIHFLYIFSYKIFCILKYTTKKSKKRKKKEKYDDDDNCRKNNYEHDENNYINLNNDQYDEKDKQLTSKFKGVNFIKYKKAWCFTYIDVDDKRKKKLFQIDDYGFKESKALSILFRKSFVYHLTKMHTFLNRLIFNKNINMNICNEFDDKYENKIISKQVSANSIIYNGTINDYIEHYKRYEEFLVCYGKIIYFNEMKNIYLNSKDKQNVLNYIPIEIHNKITNDIEPINLLTGTRNYFSKKSKLFTLPKGIVYLSGYFLWVVLYLNKNNKEIIISFSVRKYGFEKARAKCIECYYILLNNYGFKPINISGVIDLILENDLESKSYNLLDYSTENIISLEHLFYFFSPSSYILKNNTLYKKINNNTTLTSYYDSIFPGEYEQISSLDIFQNFEASHKIDEPNESTNATSIDVGQGNSSYSSNTWNNNIETNQEWTIQKENFHTSQMDIQNNEMNIDVNDKENGLRIPIEHTQKNKIENKNEYEIIYNTLNTDIFSNNTVDAEKKNIPLYFTDDESKKSKKLNRDLQNTNNMTSQYNISNNSYLLNTYCDINLDSRNKSPNSIERDNMGNSYNDFCMPNNIDHKIELNDELNMERTHDAITIPLTMPNMFDNGTTPEYIDENENENMTELNSETNNISYRYYEHENKKINNFENTNIGNNNHNNTFIHPNISKQSMNKDIYSFLCDNNLQDCYLKKHYDELFNNKEVNNYVFKKVSKKEEHLGIFILLNSQWLSDSFFDNINQIETKYADIYSFENYLNTREEVLNWKHQKTFIKDCSDISKKLPRIVGVHYDSHTNAWVVNCTINKKRHDKKFLVKTFGFLQARKLAIEHRRKLFQSSKRNMPNSGKQNIK